MSKFDFEEWLEENSTKRSLRQASTANDDLNKAISFYIKVGYEDGARAYKQESDKQYTDLLKEAEAMREALGFIENAPIFDCDCDVDMRGDILVCASCQCQSTIAHSLARFDKFMEDN